MDWTGLDWDACASTAIVAHTPLQRQLWLGGPCLLVLPRSALLSLRLVCAAHTRPCACNIRVNYAITSERRKHLERAIGVGEVAGGKLALQNPGICNQYAGPRVRMSFAGYTRKDWQVCSIPAGARSGAGSGGIT